jgi:hypothetical protein
MVQQRILQTAKGRFLFQLTQPAKDFLLREGTDMQYGARHLKRAIERCLTCPLASLLATEQVGIDDVISIDWDGKESGLSFLRENAGTLLSVGSPVVESLAQAVAASSDSRGIAVPVLKTGVAKNAVADGTVDPGPHTVPQQRVNADQSKPKTQVERVRVIARPH